MPLLRLKLHRGFRLIFIGQKDDGDLLFDDEQLDELLSSPVGDAAGIRPAGGQQSGGASSCGRGLVRVGSAPPPTCTPSA